MSNEKHVKDEISRLISGRAFAAVVQQLGDGSRGLILMTIQKAAGRLLDGGTCDLCQDRATTMRFTTIGPDEDHRGYDVPEEGEGIALVPTLCARCGGLPERELKARLLDRLAESRRAHCEAPPTPGQRIVIIGRVVGGVENLPDRATLRECENCRQTVWIDQEEYLELGDRNAHVLCVPCALAMAQSGRLELVPVGLLDRLDRSH
jgi:hypothetical protein